REFLDHAFILFKYSSCHCQGSSRPATEYLRLAANKSSARCFWSSAEGFGCRSFQMRSGMTPKGGAETAVVDRSSRKEAALSWNSLPYPPNDARSVWYFANVSA